MMDSIVLIVVFVFGFCLGIGVALVLRLTQAQTAQSLARELFRETEKRRKENETTLLETVKSNFDSLALKTQEKSHRAFLELAQQRFEKQSAHHTADLDGKKELIGQQLGQMEIQLRRVTDLVGEFEAQRAEKLGALSTELNQLILTSTELQKALASNQARGQWGERMADDILRLAGFVEGTNYGRQMSMTADDGTRSQPDFTFFLPKRMMLNMDVKFPLNNYMAYLSAESPAEQDKHLKQFMSDVRKHINTISGRAYINLEFNTADCVLMFIPNEQVYRFIHEHDHAMIDDALEKKVILCSPLTLYVVLAIIRQTAENFALERHSSEVLLLLNKIKKQWEAFAGKLEEMGKALDKAGSTYEEMIGTRRRAIERPLKDIDKLISDYDMVIPDEPIIGE